MSRTHRFVLKMMFASTCLLLGSGLLLSEAGCSKSPGAPDTTEPPPSVRSAPVRAGSLKRSIRSIGTIHSVEEIRVLARLSGKLGTLPIPEGGAVARGDLLAEIASPETGARQERVYQERGRAAIEAAFLCRQADQDEALGRAQAITMQKVETSREACRAAGKAVAAAGASLQEQSILAGNKRERAPFPGIVLRWVAQPGENVMPGQPLLWLGGHELEVRVQVPENDLVKGIVPNLPVELLFPDGTRQHGTVRTISPESVGPARTAEVRISLKKPAGATWGHGMSVEVDFVLEETARAWIVPSVAVHTSDAGSHVFIVSRGTLVRREVFPKLTVPPETAVTGRLTEIDRVVTDRHLQLHDGLPVWVAPSAEMTP